MNKFFIIEKLFPVFLEKNQQDRVLCIKTWADLKNSWPKDKPTYMYMYAAGDFIVISKSKPLMVFFYFNFMSHCLYCLIKSSQASHNLLWNGVIKYGQKNLPLLWSGTTSWVTIIVMSFFDLKINESTESLKYL